jgi:cellulose synthase/poly-beta-1,6-N-acetylglucosamine synthase-like glycosyltransferase
MRDLGGLISTLTATVGALLVLCSLLELIEIADLTVNWRRTASRSRTPRTGAAVGCQPFVSLHVPLCSEPVAVVKETLRAIAALDYAHFEAVVVYNNTSDRRLWQPIAQRCAELGPRFKFHFVRELPGFKAGALNYALRQTAADAELIGVIDADYIVEPEYLQNTVSFFADERVAFLQTPQDYRATGRSWFAASCYWEYWQFFEVGMAIRSLRNAPMLHGTMSLVRKQALLEAGGWADWCVTEDSELGLRLLSLGYQSRYVKATYGRGLLPFSFRDYKRQRWRWVAGGAQQLRRHLPRLSTGRQLSIAQKAHHLQGWLPWLRDGLLAASLPLLGLAAVNSILVPENSLVPFGMLGAGVTSVLLHHIVRQTIICRARLGLPWSHAVGATLAVMSLTLTVGAAWVLALFGRRTPFKVTPKSPTSDRRWWQDVKFELAGGAYVAGLALAMLAVHEGALSSAAVVPTLYVPLIAPAYALSFASRRAVRQRANARDHATGAAHFNHHARAELWTTKLVKNILQFVRRLLWRNLRGESEPRAAPGRDNEPLRTARLTSQTRTSSTWDWG